MGGLEGLAVAGAGCRQLQDPTGTTTMKPTT